MSKSAQCYCPGTGWIRQEDNL